MTQASPQAVRAALTTAAETCLHLRSENGSWGEDLDRTAHALRALTSAGLPLAQLAPSAHWLKCRRTPEGNWEGVRTTRACCVALSPFEEGSALSLSWQWLLDRQPQRGAWNISPMAEENASWQAEMLMVLAPLGLDHARVRRLWDSLLSHQQPDGSFGSGRATALGVEALRRLGVSSTHPVWARAVHWLRTEARNRPVHPWCAWALPEEDLLLDIAAVEPALHVEILARQLQARGGLPATQEVACLSW